MVQGIFRHPQGLDELLLVPGTAFLLASYVDDNFVHLVHSSLLLFGRTHEQNGLQRIPSLLSIIGDWIYKYCRNGKEFQYLLNKFIKI